MKNNIFNEKLYRLDTPASVAIADRVRVLTADGVKIAKLQTGEPCFATPRYIIDSASKAMAEGHTHYSNSQGLPELRKQISLWYEKDYDVRVDHKNMVITNGAIHAIFCVLAAILNPQDEVIIPEPCWPQYKYISLLFGANVKTIDTIGSNGRLTHEALRNSISEKTKVFILNNPCNPTGVVYSREEVTEFLRICSANKVFVISDEVYNRIVYTNRFCSVFSSPLYKSVKESVIYINSFSKTFAMTGWRIGYCVLPDPLIDKVLKVSQNSVTNINTFCQYAAKAAIEEKKDNENVFLQMLGLYKERREKILDMLRKKSMDFIYPEGAFYFFIDSKNVSGNYAAELLQKKHIAVVPGSAYGKGLDSYYRISFAVDEYSFNEFMRFLSKAG